MAFDNVRQGQIYQGDTCLNPQWWLGDATANCHNYTQKTAVCGNQGWSYHPFHGGPGQRAKHTQEGCVHPLYATSVQSSGSTRFPVFLYKDQTVYCV